MHSVLKCAAVAASVAFAGLAGVPAASAHDYFRYDGWGYPPRHWRRDDFAVSVGLPPPRPAFVHRTYVDVVPPVVRTLPGDPRTAALMRELGDAGRRLDSDRARGRIGSAELWRLKGRSDAIRSDALALERSHGGVIPSTGSLQARVDGLNWSINHLGWRRTASS